MTAQAFLPAGGDRRWPWLTEVRATLLLSVPLILTNLAQTVITATDVVILGWAGADYLAAGVDAVDTEEVALSTMDPMKPAVIRGVGREDYLYLLMPVRVP